VIRPLFTAVVLLSLAAPAAQAASGSLTDPTGDYPDIVRLGYTNATSRVVMSMKYAGARPQNESFYMRWGTNASKNYQVFVSSGIGKKELRLNGTKVACGSLGVTYDASTHVTRVVVPRSCLGSAPNRLRFRGIATEGLYSKDQTALSAAIARG
jgi:hypothetical protein